MKKTILLFLLLLGFTTLQAQTFNTKATTSGNEVGAKVAVMQKNTARAAIFASKKAVTNVTNKDQSTVIRFAVTQATENCSSAVGDPSQCGATTTMMSVSTSVNPTRAPGAKYYVRSSAGGSPWGQVTNEAAMDAAFGMGSWQQEFLESLNVGTVFSGATNFIFIDGSDSGASALNNFLTANLPAVEAWVNGGGKLILNAAPNVGGNINFGFGGITLEYINFANSVTAVDPGHPVFAGPLLPTATVMTGTSYNHAAILGAGLTNILVDTVDGDVSLAEMDFGNGHVIFGGMTTTNFHSPAPQAFNFRANLFVYADDYAGAGCPPFSLNGPFCEGCSDPGINSSLACGVGPNSIIQGIDVSGVPGNVNVVSFEYVQDSQGSGPGNVTVNIFCGAAGANPPPFSGNAAPLYSQTFPVNGADDGSCVSLAFTTPPTIDGTCDTMWVEVIVATGRIVYTPPVCNGNGATGTNTWIAAAACGIASPLPFSAIGFVLDAGFSATFECILGQPPVISCPMDITVANDPGVCGANVSFANAIALDPEDGVIATTQTGGPLSGDLFPVGDTDVTFSATDSDGNTSTCTFTVTVEDTEAPVIACQDISVELDPAGNYTLTPGEVLGSSSDNCGIDTVSFLVTPDPVGDCATDNPQPFGSAPTTVNSVIAIADSGIIGTDYNIDNVTLDITHVWDGDVDIRLQSPAGTILDLSTGNGGSGDNYSGTTFEDGFPNVTTGSPPFAGTYSPEGGSFAGTFGGEDINGNWTLIVSDNFPPVDDGILNDFCINFVPQSVAQNTLDLTCANIGANDVTVVVTDAAGNSSSCMAVVTVLDVTAPEIVCLGEPGTGVDSTSASPGLGIVDNTTVSTTMTVADDFVITDLDVDLDITHTWVGDLQITLESPAGTQVLIFDGSVDGCSGDNIIALLDDESANALVCQTPNAFPLTDYIPSNALAAFDGESTLGDWILSVEDTAGGDVGTVNTWTLNYSHDVSATPLVVELDANGNATLDASALLSSVNEACGYVVYVGNPAPFINECGDNLGAPIDENLPPTESTATIADSGIVGEDYSIESVNLDITHTFDGDLDIELISPSGTVLMLSDQNGGGGVNYTGTVFQDGGASIVGGVAPFTGVFEPQGGTFAATFGGEDIAGGWVLKVTDNFGGDQGTLDNFCINFAPIVSTDVNFDCSNLGLNEIEVTVVDSSGNTAMCTATVEVIDVTAPILICQDAIIVLDENGMAEINPLDLLAQLPPTFDAMVIGSDNQSGAAGTTDFTAPVTDAAAISFDWVYTSNDPDPGFDSFGYLLNGVYTQLTDPAIGNQSGSANVNVNPGDVFGFRAQTDDNIFGNTETVVTNFVPGFTGQFDPANWTLNNSNSDGDAFFVEIPGGPASFDACGITILATDVTDVTCADIGTQIVVTVFASDASGNLASCTSIITVVDQTGPVIENCPADQTVDPGPLNLFYELPDYWTTGTTAVDNCTDPVTILSQDPAAGTLLPDGVYTITMTAEDEYGNVSTCTFELTIESILGVADNTLENGVIMYPNPTKGVVNITNTTSIQLESAAIYDINGRMVQNINLSDMATEMTVDVSNLASGVYMVQIQGEGGQTVKRLIRE